MPVDKSDRRIQRMFGEIAGGYDRMNHLLSMQTDRYWRWRTVRLVPPEEHGPVLDLCSGTGDLALAYDRASGGRIAIVSADFCHEMLVIGRRKGARRGAADRLTFVEADAQQLPFADDRFQMVTVAFGLRNIADTDRGLREMTRVCRPGGKVAVLEFSEPRWRPLRAVYLWYLRRVLPKIGRLLAGSRERAYDYLSQSVVEFPSGRAMADRLRAAGLESVRYHPLTLGIATLYVGTKASRTNNESTPP